LESPPRLFASPPLLAPSAEDALESAPEPESAYASAEPAAFLPRP
jgi:hypothetical protein